MRLSVRPRAAGALVAAGLLGGCAGSGYYSYLGDTFTVPFHSNPNLPPGNSETYTKVRSQNVQSPPPMLYEAGDVWPPPPKAPPTLKDLQVQQNLELSNGASVTGKYTPLQPLPQLPGYEVPQQQTHAAAPNASFPKGVVPGSGVSVQGGRELNSPKGSGSIVVPNGNGTSTVIGPDGSVTTVPTQGK